MISYKQSCFISAYSQPSFERNHVRVPSDVTVSVSI